MNDPEDKDTPPSDEVSVLQALAIGIIFCLGYAFIWRLTKGGNIFNTYFSYVFIALCVAFILGLILPLESIARKRFPTLFEKLPELPMGYTIVALLATLACSIIGGIMDGWTTGMLIFWPAAIITSFVSHAVHWTVHHTSRWLKQPRK